MSRANCAKSLGAKVSTLVYIGTSGIAPLRVCEANRLAETVLGVNGGEWLLTGTASVRQSIQLKRAYYGEG